MRNLLRQAGETTHRFARLVGTAFLLLLLCFGAIAWRLSRGPVVVPLLAQRISVATSAALPGLNVTIGSAALAWEGFHKGGAPLDLRLNDIVMHARSGGIDGSISRLRVTLSPIALLRGRIAPILILARSSAIQLEFTRVRTPAALSPLFAVLAAGPPRKHALDFASFRLIRIRDLKISVIDPTSGVHLLSNGASLQIRQTKVGTINGNAGALFLHGKDTVAVHLTVDVSHGEGSVTAQFGPFYPSRIAPKSIWLRRFDTPTTLNIGLPIRRDEPSQPINVAADLGAGSIQFAGGMIPVKNGTFDIDVRQSGARLKKAQLHLAKINGSDPTLTATGALGLAPPYAGALRVAVDRVTASALPIYWPNRLAPDARRFVTKHITDGIATGGDFSAGFHLSPSPTLTRFHGTFVASGITLNWFPGATKMTELAGTVLFPDSDKLLISASHGKFGGLALSGTMAVDGLDSDMQVAKIAARLSGSLPDAVPSLNAPPLRLAAEGIKLAHATGNVEATVVAQLPLIRKLTRHDLTLAINTTLTDGAVPLPFVNLALEQAHLQLQADLHRVSLSGTGTLGNRPASFIATIGLPENRVHLSGKAILNSGLLTRLGVPSSVWKSGSAPLSITYKATKGTGKLDLTLDLTGTCLALPGVGWNKATGAPSNIDLTLALASGKLSGLLSATAVAPRLSFRGTRKAGSFAITTARIGMTTATGTVTPPADLDAPWTVSLRGNVLDIASAIQPTRSALGHARAKTRVVSLQGPPRHYLALDPRWHIVAKFGHVALDDGPNAKRLGSTSILATGAGTTLYRLSAVSEAPNKGKATLHINRVSGQSNIDLVSSDASSLLAAVGEPNIITGGTLHFIGHNTASGIEGRITIKDFRIPQAPAAAKLLQALTIYGIPAAASGPGLGFSRLVAQVGLGNGVLSIVRGRAESPSLGLTTSGTVDLERERYDLGGTIVPAYAINSLPGKIPVIGQLFRSDKGDGLFAARYSLTGTFTNPNASVNPLSALTPGILRDVFGPAAPELPRPANLNKTPQ